MKDKGCLYLAGILTWKVVPVFLLLLAVSSTAFAGDPVDGFHQAAVKDISDRSYEPAVINLLDSAKESIVMSMYVIKLQPKGPEPIDKDAIVTVSKELLKNKSYFPAMLASHADRDMRMYLVLLSESARTHESGFFVSLEDLAVTMGIRPEWTDTDMRRQMIKDLRSLQNTYNLVDINFNYGKDAWVELNDLTGEIFEMRGGFFDPKNLAKMSQPAIFVTLMTALMKSGGTSHEQVSIRNLSKRFSVSRYSIQAGLRDVSREK